GGEERRKGSPREAVARAALPDSLGVDRDCRREELAAAGGEGARRRAAAGGSRRRRGGGGGGADRAGRPRGRRRRRGGAPRGRRGEPRARGVRSADPEIHACRQRFCKSKSSPEREPLRSCKTPTARGSPRSNLPRPTARRTKSSSA